MAFANARPSNCVRAERSPVSFVRISHGVNLTVSSLKQDQTDCGGAARNELRLTNISGSYERRRAARAVHVDVREIFLIQCAVIPLQFAKKLDRIISKSMEKRMEEKVEIPATARIFLVKQ